MESESHRLVHSLTAHLALYHSHLYNPSPNPTLRDSILRWFSSLSSAHRQAALTVSDFSFIEILLQMKSRLRRQGHSHFLLLPDILSSSHPSLPSLSSRPSRGLLSRSAASNLSAELLSNSLLLFSSNSPGSAIADALTVSESLVTDVDRFVSVMDGLSGRRFLCEEVEMPGLIVQWVELPWLKDMGYYSLESFVANRLEVVLRLAWISSQGAKKPKEKRLKEKAAEAAGKAANVFWRMKGCLGWWVGLDLVTRKGIISSFFGKTAKALADEIIKEDNATLENRYNLLNTEKNIDLTYGDSSSWKKPRRAIFRRDVDFGLDFLPSKVPNNLVITWNKLIVVHEISHMLLAWLSRKSEAEKLFFGSLSSNSTVFDIITMKLQRLLMVVYTNSINHELMEDTKLNIYPRKKVEEKSNLVCRKGKNKSRSLKKSNVVLKAYNATSMPLESCKNLEDSTELFYKDSTSSPVTRRIIDGIFSPAINNVPEVKLLVAQEEMDNANASVPIDFKENNSKRKNKRKGAKNKCIKNIGKPKQEENKGTFLFIAAEKEPTGTIGYVGTKPISVDVSTCDNLLSVTASDISQEYMMMDDFQSSQDIQEYQPLSLAGVASTGAEECHRFSGKRENDIPKYVPPCLRKTEISLQTPYRMSTYPNEQIDVRMSSIGSPSMHTCELGSLTTNGIHEHLLSRVSIGTASKSFVSKGCSNAAADERKSVIPKGGSECYTGGAIDFMGGTSYEWPSITPLHYPPINSHLLPATDRLHLDVGARLPHHNHRSSVPSKAYVGNSFSESAHGQILPSLNCPLSYDWPPMVKSYSIRNQTQNITYESSYSQSMPPLYSRLASCAAHGVQVNVASGDNEAKHAGDVIDAFDMKNISDLVEDESYWLSEEEHEPHARHGRDYNKYFGGGVMYWNPAEFVGIGFSRPPSHSSEDSSWAWHEADLNRTIDDMVGCKSGLPTYNTNGMASPPSSYCSPFDNLTSGHQSIGYAIAGNDGSSTVVHSPSLSYSSDEKFSSATANSTACIEGVKGDPFPYPILPPIIIPGMSRKGSRSDLRLGHDNRSPCLPSARSDNPRIKRPPSPVVLCVPRVPRPSPPSIVEGSRKRGFPIVRSGSSSPRHWGVKSCCHEDSTLADIHHCLDGAEVVWPTWARKSLGVTAVAQSLQGSLLHDHLITISQLAHDQEHPDVALPLQPPDLLNGRWKGSLSIMQNLLHEEIDFFCNQVSANNLIRKPYINWAIKRVTRSLQVLWPRSRTNIFGSNSTGLALPTSDVDLVVSLPPVRNLEPIKEAGILEGRNGIKETCLQHATRYLANQEWVRNDSLKTIENTAIPLIMLVAEVPCDVTLSHGTSSVVDISEEKSSKICAKHSSVSLLNLSHLENVITSKTSSITKDDAVVGSKSVRLDISFKSISHTGLQTSELVRELTQQFPASVPLALVLKKFLADRSLDHSYSGGLSSYCLVLLITRFLQHEHHCGHSMKQNLGSLLMDFLYFFGNVFDPRHMRISIQGSGVYMKRERGHCIDPIHIDDPLFPANNVGRNCFRIHQCIKAFADAFTILENELTLISEEPVSSPIQSFALLRKIVPSIDCME